MFTKCIDGKWTVPSLAPFSYGKFYEGGPVISADDNKLYIYRGKPAPPGGNADRGTLGSHPHYSLFETKK